jgi:plasmid replication initiation protein
MIKNSRRYAVKSNPLIKMCAKFEHSEYRVFNYILSQVNPYDETKRSKFNISAKEMMKFYGTDETYPKFYKSLRETILIKLMNKKITKDVKCEKKKKINIVSSVCYHDGFGTFELEFHNDILCDIYELHKHFTMIDLDLFKNIKGYYTMRIYELCVMNNNQQINNKSKQAIFEVKYQDLCEILQVSESYTRFFTFKAKVLDKTIEQLNRIEDLEFTIKYKKIVKSRSDINIMFILERKNFVKSEDKPKRNITPKTKKSKQPKEIETAAPKNHLINKRTQEELDIARKGLEKLRAVL